MNRISNNFRAVFFLLLGIFFLTGFSPSDQRKCKYPEGFEINSVVGLDDVSSDIHSPGFEKSGTVSFWNEIPYSPSTRMPDKIVDDYWHSEFQRVNQEVAGAEETEIVFFGNSITWSWSLGPATGLALWQSEYGHFNPINMGNSGDITPVMLYRTTHGNLDFPKDKQPKVAVLLCGTNNFVVSQSAGGKVQWGLGPESPPEDVANGARAIAQVFRRRLPETRVIMLGILPVSQKEKWVKCQQVNDLNATLHYNNNEVVYLDLQEKFMDQDGSLKEQLYTDGTHLTEEGYHVWVSSIDSVVSAMMEAAPLDPTKIMLIGGSITEGSSSSLSYRRYLDGMLRRDGNIIDFVGSRSKHNNNSVEPDNYQYDIDHEGYWGKKSEWLANKVPQMLEQNIPDIALIQTGIEDILSCEGNVDFSADKVVDNIDEMVRSLRLKKKDINIVLSNLIPVKGKSKEVEVLNQKISAYVKAHSNAKSPIILADQYSKFSCVFDHSVNEVKLDDSGALQMAEVYADAIKELLISYSGNQ